MQDMRGNVALITGGTTGIGLHIAGAFLQAGAAVALNGRNRRRGEEALRKLGHPAASFVAGDCADPAEARRVVEQAVAAHGRLTTLVTSGGAADLKPGLFHEVDDSAFVDVYRFQFLNRVYPIRAALPHLKDGGGSVLIISTDAGRTATVGETFHGAIGAAKIMLTKTLAREFARWRIRVNCMALTLTAGTESFDEAMARNDWVTHLYEKAMKRFPFGAPPTADEVARVALFFASDQSAQVTGQTLSVNGGLSYGGW